MIPVDELPGEMLWEILRGIPREYFENDKNTANAG